MRRKENIHVFTATDIPQLTSSELFKLWHDQAYGIMTRGAIEIEYNRRKNSDVQYVVFIDIDKIHDLNSQYATETSDGYEIVNAMVREAFVLVRSTDLLIGAGRYQSGDECVFLIQGDPDVFCEKLMAALCGQGLSATMAYTEPLDDFEETVKRAAIKVQQAKKARPGGGRR